MGAAASSWDEEDDAWGRAMNEANLHNEQAAWKAARTPLSRLQWEHVRAARKQAEAEEQPFLDRSLAIPCTREQDLLPLLRLTYASIVAVSTRHVAHAIVGSIVQSSASKNASCGIGGALFLNTSQLPYHVVQILEGPDAAVRALFASIQRDLRYERCELIDEHRITASERHFTKWGIRPSDFDDLDGLCTHPEYVRDTTLERLRWWKARLNGARSPRAVSVRKRTPSGTRFKEFVEPPAATTGSAEPKSALLTAPPAPATFSTAATLKGQAKAEAKAADADAVAGKLFDRSWRRGRLQRLLASSSSSRNGAAGGPATA